MTRVAPIIPEPVGPTQRKPMTPKRRLELLLAFNGKCARCGEKIEGPGWVANHIAPLAMGGADELGNLEPLHKTCDGEITPGDLRRIAKAKRQKARHEGTRRPRKQIQSRGFSKTLRKRFDGTVEPRP